MATKPIEDMTDDELEAAQRETDGEEAGESNDSTDSSKTTGEGEEEAGQDGDADTEQTEEGQDEQEEHDEQTDANGADDTQANGEAQSSAVAEPGKVVGVASKDGSRILPYSALKAERRSAARNAARAERAERELEKARKEIEDLRAGRSTDSGELTEEEVQRLEADFPEEGKRVRAIFERNKELTRQIAEAKPKDADEDDAGDDPVQDAIDQVPLLVEWQHDPEQADKWERAVALDSALQNSPKWKDKPAVDRFAHVAKLVAEEFDLEVPDTAGKPSPKPDAKGNPSTAKKPPQQRDPKQVIERADRQPPSTLSDLKGGSVPDHGQMDLQRMSPQRMLDKFMDLPDDEIDRQLAKLG